MRRYQVLGVDRRSSPETASLVSRALLAHAPVVKAGKGEEARHCKAVVKARRRRAAGARPKEPPTSTTNRREASQKQDGSQSKVQSYCAFRRPCTPRRSSVARAAPPTPCRAAPPSRAQGTRAPRSPSTRTARSPPSRTRCDPCPEAGARRRRRPRGRAGRNDARWDGDFAVVDGARVVGVNSDRDRVSYDRVVDALATAARPLLVLLASVPQGRRGEEGRAPAGGPLGLRLADARLKDGAPVARVARVAPGGRAWKGGVVVGDVLTVVDGDNVAGYAPPWRCSRTGGPARRRSSSARRRLASSRRRRGAGVVV